MLPSLDRLAGLIERVVELVDEVSATSASAPERPAEAGPPQQPPPRPALPAPPPEVVATNGWFAFVPSPQGYALVDLPGSVPAPGDELAVEGAHYRVLRYAPSPLPGDRRRCVIVEMEEPPATERTPDA